MPKYRLISLVTTGKDLHPSLPTDIKKITFEAAHSANPGQLDAITSTSVKPRFMPQTLHTVNFRKMVSMRPQIDVRGNVFAPISFGDLMPNARHEVVYSKGDFSAKPLAFSSSWPSTHFTGSSDVPARFVEHLNVSNLPQTEQKQGLKILLQRIEEFAFEQGEKAIFTFVAKNEKSFFERLGYTTLSKSAPFKFVKILTVLALPLVALNAWLGGKQHV